MKGYKGFEKGLVCRGKQYAENTVFKEDKAVICEKGMHFCKNPFDVLEYYPLINDECELNEFAEVEALDDAKTDDDKKFCTTKLKIGAKLSLKGFIEACVGFVIENTKHETKNDVASSKLVASGDSSQLAASGKHSVVAGIGINNIAKAVKGCWITLAEWRFNSEEDKYIPVCVKTEYVDGERIKENTFYKMENCEFVEVNNN